VQPEFLDNFSQASGWWEVQDFSFEEVTEVTAIQTNTFVGRKVAVVGNTLTKTGAAGWDGDAYSLDSYTGGAFASAKATSVSTNVMFGLNSDPTTDSSYASIDYALHLAEGTLYEYRGPTQVRSLGTYVAGDILAVTYDGVEVRYLKNGNVLGSIEVSITGNLFFDSSFYQTGSSLTNVQFGPLTSIGAVTTSVGSKLSKSAADTLTGPINLSAANAITVGTPALDSVTGKNGFYIGSTGIVATKNGKATVVISNSGDASFSGTLSTGSNPALSGSTMTGSGAIINTDGSFAIGNSTTNITGSSAGGIQINGSVVNTGNIGSNAVSTTVYSSTDTGTITFTNSNILVDLTESLGSNFTPSAANTPVLIDVRFYIYINTTSGGTPNSCIIFNTLQVDDVGVSGSGAHNLARTTYPFNLGLAYNFAGSVPTLYLANNLTQAAHTLKYNFNAFLYNSSGQISTHAGSYRIRTDLRITELKR
jgi:hypothetical protein